MPSFENSLLTSILAPWEVNRVIRLLSPSWTVTPCKMRKTPPIKPIPEDKNISISIIEVLAIYLLLQGFFSALAKKLKVKKTQTQEKFPENSRIFCPKTQKSGNFGVTLGKILNFQPKICLFERKNGYFSKNSRIFPKLKPKIGQKLKVSETPLTFNAAKVH